MKQKSVRINARITESVAKKLKGLVRSTGSSMSELIGEAIERFAASQTKDFEIPLKTLTRVGFIGCGEADAHFSVNAKKEFEKALEKKHGNR